MGDFDDLSSCCWLKWGVDVLLLRWGVGWRASHAVFYINDRQWPINVN